MDPAEYRMDDFGRTIPAGPPATVNDAPTADSGVAFDLVIPDGATVVGQLLLIFMGWNNNGSDVQTVMNSEGFTPLPGGPYANGVYRFNVFYRVITGTEGFTGTGDAVTISPIASANVVAVSQLVKDQYDDSGPQYVINPGSTADPDAISSGSWSPAITAGTGMRYYTALFTDAAGTIDAPPTGYTNVDTATSGSLAMSLDAKDSTSDAEDPGAYSESGGNTILESFTLGIVGAGSGGWGSIPQGIGVDTEAPWEGGNTYDVTATGMAVGVSGSAGYMTAAVDGASATAELSSEADDTSSTDPWGPWTSGRGLFDIKFKVNPIGDTADTDANTLELAVAGDGWRGSLIIALGDAVAWSWMDPDSQRGIVISQKAGVTVESDFVAKTLASDTYYNAKFDTRGEVVRAKLWASADAEPAAWDISVDKEYQALVGNWFYVQFDANAGMTLTVDYIDAALGATPGASLGRHVVGYGNGTATTFYTVAPFVAGSLLVWVDNQPVIPASYDASAGTFTLGRAPYGDPADPTGSAVVEASFEAA